MGNSSLFVEMKDTAGEVSDIKCLGKSQHPLFSVLYNVVFFMVTFQG